jgi:hypothetical protein
MGWCAVKMQTLSHAKLPEQPFHVTCAAESHVWYKCGLRTRTSYCPLLIAAPMTKGVAKDQSVGDADLRCCFAAYAEVASSWLCMTVTS